jgi:photosystem II stability/assembly factor-like uncharacterized protein
MKQTTIFILSILIPAISLAQTDLWQQTVFPQQYGDWIDAIHISPNGTIFAGTRSDGLMRSTNDGQTWEQVAQSGGDGYEVKLIETTSQGHVFAYVNSHLIRSIDNGTSWTTVTLPDLNNYVSGLSIDSNDNLYLSTSDMGILLSHDDGKTWTQITNGLPTQWPPGGVVISKSDTSEILFVSVRDYNTDQSTLYRSKNKGESWTSVVIQNSYMSDPFIHSNGYVFFEGVSGLMRSTDNGDHWQVVSSFLSLGSALSMPSGDIWCVSGSGINCSIDNGITWVALGTPAISSAMSIVRSASGYVLLGTDRNGIFKTTDDGLTWQPINLTGFPKPTSQITSITGRHGGVLFAGTSQFGNFISRDWGVTWTRNIPGSLTINRLAAHPNGLVFCAPQGALCVSEDDGNHWRYTGNVYSWDVTIDQNGYIYSCGNYTSGVQRSTDLGQTWKWLPCPGTTYLRMHVTRMGMIVVLTPYHEDNPYRTWNYIRTSADGGSTWIGSTLNVADADINEFASTNNGYIFVASSIGVYRSTDSGRTWYPTNNGITTSDIRSLATNTHDEVFAGTANRGIFRSTDYGYNWEPFNTGLTDTTITSLYCDADGFLIAGGWNQGIYKTFLSTTSVRENETPPLFFSLMQNYPNPFNPTTTIEFQIARTSYVTLTVFDLLGREVKTLVNEEMKAGRYQKSFDGSQLAGGMYVYRLRASQSGDGHAVSISQTKKLLLIK